MRLQGLFKDKKLAGEKFSERRRSLRSKLAFPKRVEAIGVMIAEAK
jgi:hypothetical protein